MQKTLTFPIKPAHNDKFRGEKYNSALRTVDCAAAIRADIKEAVKAGKLPSGKYSVRSSSYSGGSAIDVRVSNLPFVVMARQRASIQAQHPNLYPDGFKQHTDLGTAVLDAVAKIVGAYNRDNSDTQTDYFDVKFYSSVQFDYEWTGAQLEALKAQEKAAPRWIFTVDAGRIAGWREA